jgi:hypothetical protein
MKKAAIHPKKNAIATDISQAAADPTKNRYILIHLASWFVFTGNLGTSFPKERDQIHLAFLQRPKVVRRRSQILSNEIGRHPELSASALYLASWANISRNASPGPSESAQVLHP